MIEIRNITLAFDSNRLITDASARFARGNMVALLGRNGTGKSTLLRAMAGLGKVAEGDIIVDGKNLATLSATERAEHIAFVNTERVDVDALTVRELVGIGRSPYTNWIGRLTKEDSAIVEHAMEVTGVMKFAERKVNTLSDGEAQRAMIARALAQDTPIILLDEPTSFLDLPNRYELCRLLSDLAHKENKCVIFSTHELDIALSLADSIALVDTPRLVHLPTAEMITSGNIERLFDSEYISFDATSRSIHLKR
ncbi:MAG: ABC transporter ATP-binding protein [Alistipes sp.]|nr:ABC transporter ATP-binding protein [Alistipes sp.]